MLQTGEQIATGLQEYHDNPLGGNCGFKKIFPKIKQHFKWKGMHRDISGYITKCREFKIYINVIKTLGLYWLPLTHVFDLFKRCT